MITKSNIDHKKPLEAYENKIGNTFIIDLSL